MGDDEIKKAGLKVTLPRVKILKILQSSQSRHMSAEDIYRTLIDSKEVIGLATVYRVLTQFEEVELVKRHHFEGGHSVFELNLKEHHDHLVCVKCGRVEEFIDPLIESQQLKVAAAHHYQMTDHSLNIYGICQGCQ